MGFLKTRECTVCGHPFDVAWNRTSPKQTCSRSCQTKLGARSRNFKGERNPAYKGGTAVYGNYEYVRGKSKKRLVQRVVMERVLGRPLEDGEEVHHINGDPLDNRPENLFLVGKRNHSRLHFALFVRVQRLERENELLREQLAKATASHASP